MAWALVGGLAAMWAKLARWVEGVVSLDGTLDGRERRHRLLHFVVGGPCLVLSACFPLLARSVTLPVVISSILGAALALSAVVPCLLKLPLHPNYTRGQIVVLAVSIVATDIHMHASSSTSIWPMFVLLADFSLLMRLGQGFALCLVLFTALWLVVVQVETVTRFGMFDLPGTPTDAERRSELQDRHMCDHPPCARSVQSLVFDGAICLLVLAVDFIATRGFADEAEREQASMAHTIDVVETIAQLLAGYDVDTVATMLEEMEGRLPAKMHSALQHLEQNLRVYRPYLPAILLEQVRGETEPVCQPVAAPGTVTEEATIVFTDVRASTSIWEAAPEAMKKAMQMHNAVMRKAAAELGGYEVKTIGDAFMVAFEGVCAGVDFGLAVQEHLLDADWPPALLEQPICKRTPLWGGLTVRVGVNHGPLTVETNAVTGRVDYFGHTVNVAARLEGVCVPGAVAMLYDTWAQVNTACQPAVVGAPVLVVLRGVSEEVPVCNVWPQRLQERRYAALQGTRPLKGRTPRAVRSLSFDNVRDTFATMGIIRIQVDDRPTVPVVNETLESVMPLLEQSAGTLVTLLGMHASTGWNIGCRTPAHVESALRFARQALQFPWIGQVCLATGHVHHGTVGTSTQRFVTVAGEAVENSLALLRIAHDTHKKFLYSGTQEAVVGAVRHLVVPAAFTKNIPIAQGASPRFCVSDLYEFEAADSNRLPEKGF